MHDDVVVVGGGLVGLSLAYELAGLGAAVTVVDAAHRGRATDAGAGILSPATTTDEDREWFEVLGACGRHYPSCWPGWAPTAWTRRGALCRLRHLVDRAAGP